MKRKIVLSIVGARPQFIKAAALSPALRKHFREVLLHTGQHYDYEMSQAFFGELAIPKPDINLRVGSGTHAEQTGLMMVGIEKAAWTVKPDLVLVYGDTNSTLAGALVASKFNIPLGHVEAGLRSYNPAMPEETNRLVADRLSDLLFCPTETARRNLSREGLRKGVFLTGDVMYDLLLSSLPKVRKIGLKRWGVSRQGYFLATVHRAGNADDPGRLASLLAGFGRLPEPVVFPAHPRTRKALGRLPKSRMADHVRLIPPVGYLEMLALEAGARAVLTDSCGVQKEAYWLGVPCVTLRDETEWTETLAGGWNVLAGADPRKIERGACRLRPRGAMRKAFGDGRAAQKITEKIAGYV
jgi:UDP-GlcNAc3NAcA epimerase